jgi:NTE family protein
VVASAAVPGLLPPAKVGDEHFLDGGIVNSIPLGRAVELGARRIFVLQVGRVDKPLTVPTRPWDVARVSFEISRRHRYLRELAAVPPDVDVHVMPTGSAEAQEDSLFAYRSFSAVRGRIEQAHVASTAYLSRLEGPA